MLGVDYVLISVCSHHGGDADPLHDESVDLNPKAETGLAFGPKSFGCVDWFRRTISIARRPSLVSEVATLRHEMGHILCSTLADADGKSEIGADVCAIWFRDCLAAEIDFLNMREGKVIQ